MQEANNLILEAHTLRYPIGPTFEVSPNEEPACEIMASLLHIRSLAQVD